MKEKQALLYQGYPDLLDPSADPELVPVIQELDSVCNAPVAPASLNWSQVRLMQAQQSTRKKGVMLPFPSLPSLRYPLARKAVLIPALIGLVLITAAFTFAFSPLLQSMLNIEPSGSGLLSRHAFVDLKKSITIAGRTVTLEAGYADANQIILGYTVSPSSSEGRLWVSSKLTTSTGIELPGMFAAGDNETKDSAEAWYFDASAITGNPATLDFHLAFTLQETMATAKPVKVLPTKMLGAATFDFTLPFHAGKIIPPQQQVISHGKIGMLVKGVITESATRIVLHIDGLTAQPPAPSAPAGTEVNLPNSVTLQVPGNSNVDPGFVGPDDVSGDLILFYPYNLVDKTGTWTLTVKSGTDTWVFQFEMPKR